MVVVLDHLSVPTKDKVAAAEWYARVFGSSYEGPYRDYAPVRVSPALQLNFTEADGAAHNHYAFRTSVEELEAIRGRVADMGVAYGSTTSNLDGQIYRRNGLLGFYFDDICGHGLEIIADEPAAQTH